MQDACQLLHQAARPVISEPPSAKYIFADIERAFTWCSAWSSHALSLTPAVPPKNDAGTLRPWRDPPAPGLCDPGEIPPTRRTHSLTWATPSRSPWPAHSARRLAVRSPHARPGHGHTDSLVKQQTGLCRVSETPGRRNFATLARPLKIIFQKVIDKR